jgi:tetraacyldisaccharide 4'-kinase
LRKDFADVYQLEYKDHHYYTYDDVNEMRDAYLHIESENKILITTEKDASRLMLLQDKIIEYQLPFYAQAISIDFLFNETEQFNQQIMTFVQDIIPPLPETEISEI